MKRNQFGNVRKLPSGRFQVRYQDLDGNPQTAKTIDGKSLTFETDKQARMYLLHLQSDRARGIDPYAIIPASADTLRKRVEMYLDPLAGSRLTSKPLRISTARNYRRLADDYLFRQIDGFCLAEMPITAITRADVRKWHSLIQASCTSKQMIDAGAPMIKNYKEIGSGAVQLAQAYRFLRATINVAIDDGIMKENPCRIKGAGTPRHAERPIITPEQIAALANEVPDRYSILVILAAYSSIRSSELLGLQRRHINELQSVIKIEHQLTNYASDDQLFMPPKTEAGIRDVPITKELMQALITHIDRFVSDPSPDALIFTTSTGAPLFKGRKSWFVTAKRRLGLDHLHFHDLRHTGQSLAMVKGANTKDLQRRAGQSSEAAARIYMHGSKVRDREVAESLTDYVNESLAMWRNYA